MAIYLVKLLTVRFLKKSVMNEPYSKLRNLRKELGRNNYKIIEATRHI